jgi:hypothetical protein
MADEDQTTDQTTEEETAEPAAAPEQPEADSSSEPAIHSDGPAPMDPAPESHDDGSDDTAEPAGGAAL